MLHEKSHHQEALPYGGIYRREPSSLPRGNFQRQDASPQEEPPDMKSLLRAYGTAGKEVLAELCWGQRCIICDTPGRSICERCLVRLPYLDRWTCCPSCGAPWGHILCCSCNSFALNQLSRTELPFNTCRSALLYTASGKKLVRSYKDQGERTLASFMAALMVSSMEPVWTREPLSICYIPASKAAVRKRGFDHMELVASRIQRATGFPITRAFSPPNSKDQRKLGRVDRFANMQEVMHVIPSQRRLVPQRILLIDDVYTTGATLFAAADQLKRHGAKTVYGLTFARVP